MTKTTGKNAEKGDKGDITGIAARIAITTKYRFVNFVSWLRIDSGRKLYLLYSVVETRFVPVKVVGDVTTLFSIAISNIYIIMGFKT